MIKTDLGYSSNTYREDLQRILSRSRFLIVLCSPSSRNSMEVDWEIQEFIRSHPDHKQSIIPVLLSGSPGKEDDPLPDGIRTIREIAKKNLPDMNADGTKHSVQSSWESGAAALILYMLQTNHANIRKEFLKRKIRNAFRICWQTLPFLMILPAWYGATSR